MLYVFEAKTLPAEVALLECHEEHPEHLTRVERGDALTCVLALLERLTPAQVSAVMFRHAPVILCRIADRAGEVAHRQQVAEAVARVAEWDREDRRVGDEPTPLVAGAPD